MASENTRDLRSASQDPKRQKERSVKWSRGIRPLPGCWKSWDDTLCSIASEGQLPKVRPARPLSSFRYPFSKQSHSRVRPDATEELNDPALSRSLIDMLPSASYSRKPSLTDNILYSFDQAETPGKPQSLAIFVKANPKEMEKLIEKEYEILDQNGDLLKGRKARRNLRRQNLPVAQEPELLEDEGFELV